MNPKIKKLAPQIWEAIQNSKSVLLHSHPGADGDSLGSALAMKHMIEGLGKKATVILGDDEKVPVHLQVLPGWEQVVVKNYLQIDPTQYDLFLIQDSSSIDRISRLGEVKFPETMKTVVIDHHASNTGFGDLNLTVPETIATGEIIFELFKIWKVEITKDIASCLFISIYTDSGGFKFAGVTEHTFDAAGELVSLNPDFHKLIFEMNNNENPKSLLYKGLILTHIEAYFNGQVALSALSFDELQKNGIPQEFMSGSWLSNELISVPGWDVGIVLTEKEKDQSFLSMRTRDVEKYDLSKLALELGGGGHKAAAGATIKAPFDEAKKQLLAAIQKTYPELGTP
jgi:phosphoesterase RecJ-like protein